MMPSVVGNVSPTVWSSFMQSVAFSEGRRVGRKFAEGLCSDLELVEELALRGYDARDHGEGARGRCAHAEAGREMRDDER